MILPKEFYTNDDVLDIAQALLGKVLCTNLNGVISKGIILETEAYMAPEDKASHAYNNKKTKRTETMFKEGGRSYVYLCYGIHSMMNVVSAYEGCAHATLIRALQPIKNIGEMKKRVQTRKKDHLLCSGPGNVCKAMGITKDNNDVLLYSNTNSVWIEDGDLKLSYSIAKSARVGIAYAKEYASKPWRFYFADHPSVSKPLQPKYD